MSRGITVKLPTHKIIKALEASLATLEANWTSQEVKEAKLDKARKAWQKEVVEYVVANIKKAENFRTNYRSYSNNLNIDFDLTVLEKDLPKEPQQDYVTLHAHSYNEQKQEIENAIRILKMTDEPTVNASTMKQIAKYL